MNLHRSDIRAALPGFKPLSQLPAGTLPMAHARVPGGTDQALGADAGALVDFYDREGSTPPLFVSYYTQTSPYIERVERLRSTLDRYCLPHRIEQLADQGSWVANTGLKAQIMQRAWATSDRPICWIDADAALLRAPGFLSDLPFDMACVRRFGWYDLSGLVYFSNAPVAGRVIDRWAQLCAEHPLTWDQPLLTLAWYQVAQVHAISSLWMPDDLFQFPQSGQRGGVAAPDPLPGRIEPVFDQTQASRAVKARSDFVPVVERSSDHISAEFRAALRASDFSFDADLGTAFMKAKTLGETIAPGRAGSSEMAVRPLDGAVHSD